MLDIHSDAQQCGTVLLELSDHLSRYLRPVAPGVKNPEVDYTLVIRSVITSLATSAPSRPASRTRKSTTRS